MTYFPFITIKGFSDSVNLDAFGKLRTSVPFVQFDAKKIAGLVTDSFFIVTKSLNSASSSFNTNRASTTLYVAAVSGSRNVRQSRKRMYYQPGKGLVIGKTFLFGTGSVGVVKRTGYFDDLNGIFLEQSGSDINLVVRSSVTGVPVDTKVSQSAWNINKFDGSNPLLPVFDPTKSQGLYIDLQWSGGGGRIRTGFQVSGGLALAHQFLNTGTTPINISNPNLPSRTEIENYSNTSANSIETFTVVVQTDGGLDPIGSQRSVDRGTQTKSVTSGSFKPILSIKLTSGSQGQVVTPSNYSFFCTTSDVFKWAVILNPIYSTVDSPSWQIVSGSNVQYDVSRDGSIVGGYVLDSGYGSGGSANGSGRITSDVATTLNYNIGFSVDGISDEIVLAVNPLTTLSILGQIGWNEV